MRLCAHYLAVVSGAAELHWAVLLRTWTLLSPALLMALGKMDPSLLPYCPRSTGGIGRQSLYCWPPSASVLPALFRVLLPCLRQQEQRLSQLPVLLRRLKGQWEAFLLGLQKQ